MPQPDQPQPEQPQLQARERQLNQLTHVLKQVAGQRRPRLVAVRGELGSGKTSLLDQFLNDHAAGVADLPRLHVARARAGGPAESYRPVVQALGSLISTTAETDLKRGEAMLRAVWEHAPLLLPAILELVSLALPPAIAALLKAAMPFVLHRLPKRDERKAPEQRPALGRDPSSTQLISLLGSYARQQPLVLLIDDAQHTDPGTAELLKLAVRELRREAVPLLVVVAYQPEARYLDTPVLPIEQTVHELTLDGLATAVDLERLHRMDIGLVVARKLGAAPPSDALGWLEEQTHGVPRHLVELVTALREHRGLRDPTTWTRERLDKALARLGDLPWQQRAVAARLDRLPASEQELLTTAAVFGSSFHADGLTTRYGAPKEQADRMLDDLLQRRLIESEPGAGRRYRFANATMREFLLERTRRDPHTYRERHRACAEWLETQPDDADRFAELAEHYREAGQLDDAIGVAERAAEAARSHGAWRGRAVALAYQVERWTEHADALLQVRAANAAADALTVALRFGEALEAINRARIAAASARPARMTAADRDSLAGHQAATWALQAAIESQSNPAGDRLNLASAAVEVYERLDPSWRPWLLFALHTRSWLAMRGSDWPGCEASLSHADKVLHALQAAQQPSDQRQGEDGIPPAARSDPERWAAQLAQVRGEAQAEQGHWGKAKKWLRQALKLSKKFGDLLGEAAAAGWLGLARCHTGDMGGLQDIHRALAIDCYDLGSEEGVAKWLTKLGSLHHERGELELAAGTLWLAKGLWEDLGHTASDEIRTELKRVRTAIDRSNDGRYRRLGASFNPWSSPYARYAFLWRLPPFGGYGRFPMMRPRGTGWESVAVRSPGIVILRDRIVMVYQGVGPDPVTSGKLISMIGEASGTDPTALERGGSPIQLPMEAYEWERGLREPRVALIDGVLQLTMTTDDGRTPRIMRASGPDLHHLNRHELVFSNHRGLATSESSPGQLKSAAFIPGQINGKWWLLLGDGHHIWIAFTEDLEHCTIVPWPVLSPQPGTFFSELIELGPPPMISKVGIHLLFNGAQRHDGARRYAVGEALLSLSDPTQVLRYSLKPILNGKRSTKLHGSTRHEAVLAGGLGRWQQQFLLYVDIENRYIGLATADAAHGPPL